MKKKALFISLIILLICITISIIFYKNNRNNAVYQNIAWESLDKISKDSIIGTKEDSKVKEKTINGKTFIEVSFHSKDEGMLGPIIVIINAETKKFEGIPARK